MGSGTSVECNRCAWSTQVDGGAEMFVVLRDSGLFPCPHPCEYDLAELVTGEPEDVLWREKRLRWYRHCWCLGCRQGGYYAWGLWQREGFLDRDFSENPSGEMKGWRRYIAPSVICSHVLSRCLACGRWGCLVSDGVLDLFLWPVWFLSSLLEHRRGGKPQYWLPCPRCTEGRLHLDAYIS